MALFRLLQTWVIGVLRGDRQRAPARGLAYEHMTLFHEARRTERAFGFFAGMARRAIPESASQARQATVHNPEAQIKDEAQQQVEHSVTTVLSDAFATYHRQMVVVWASLTEAAIEHYLEVVFSNYPDRIRSCLAKRHLAQSRSDPESAARIIRSLSHRKMKSSLIKASGGRLKKFDFDRIDELNRKRNEIVHEWSQATIVWDQLATYSGAVCALIDALAIACTDDNIPVKDTDYYGEHPNELTP